MAKNGKNSSGLSYSLRIGPSTYYVSSHRAKDLKDTNDHPVSEDAGIRPKSAKASIISSPNSQRSKSHRSPKTIYYPKFTDDIYLETQQHQTPNQIHHRRYTPVRSKRSSKTPEKTTRTDQKISSEKCTQENNKNNKSSIKGIDSKRKQTPETLSNSQKEEIIRIFNDQKASLMQSLEQKVRTIMVPSTHTIKDIVTEVLQSQDQTPMKRFESALVQTMKQELEKALPKSVDSFQSNWLDVNSLDRLENVLTQVVEKCLTKMHRIDNTILNQKYTEEKKVTIETPSRNQSAPGNDLIRQSVIDALDEYNNSRFNAAKTLTSVSNIRPSSTNTKHKELNITANLNRTRVDTAFRQQRDTTVANRYLRETVRQWSKVRSISSLVKKIQACATNDVEHAWLLFCWMSQNILYDSNCQNYLAENTFQYRAGSCQGFVNLYYECCMLMNIECLKISGYIKENFLRKDADSKKKSLHSWNGIILDDYTYLIDATLGARNYHNNKYIEDYYFIISPEELIYTHFSKGYQLLQPEITEEEFLRLPLIKSNYYRLNLSLLSPKRIYNQTSDNLFKISIRTPAYVDLLASLKIDDTEYPSHLHTLCQRDVTHADVINCYVAPPTDGLFHVTICAKITAEKLYQDALYMRLYVSDLIHAVTFPTTCSSFDDYRCTLIAPFRRIVHKNEYILIHMKIPDANMVKIKNGDDYIIPSENEYENDLLRKEVHVQGDIHVCALWHDNIDQLSTICIFKMI